MTDEKRGDSLGRAIGDIRRDATHAPRPNSASAEGAGGTRPGLEHILAGQFGGEVRAAARPGVSERPVHARALAELAVESRTPAASQPHAHTSSLSRSVAMVVLVLLCAILFVQRQRAEPAPEAATFQTQVETLGRAVDDYKKARGQLPVSLAQLPQFPANGIEASFRNYRLRLLADQPEFFFEREAAGGFVLVGRYRGEVWMYTEGSRRPLRRLGPRRA